MNVKLDENMPTDLVDLLQGLGHDVHTVPQEMLARKSDPVVQRAARAEARFPVTQDKRFVDERKWRDDPGAGAMLVRIENAGRGLLTKVVYGAFLGASVENWIGAIVVVTRNKVRLRPLRRKDNK